MAAMDRMRVERLEIACNRPEPPTERELLQLVPGVGLRTLQFLEEGGYRWKGELYSSLSRIAQAITGAKWSGPRFFGLRK